MNHINSKKIYFPNLNGLRCIAALLVLVHHIEQLKSLFRLPNYYEKYDAVKQLGTLGVNLFFVLSGFLITYLLLEEEHLNKTISIGKFYVRRILRIWPLYFLIIFLAFGVLPHISFFSLPDFSNESLYSNIALKLILYGMLFPNIAQALFGIIPYASHTWSIGTEEQFYLLWPLLLKSVKKYRVFLMLSVVVAYIIIAFFLQSSLSVNVPFRSVLYGFWRTFNIDCMAVGGLFAILLFRQHSFLSFLLKRFIFYPALAIILNLLFGVLYIKYFQQEIYAALFGIIILNLAAGSNYKTALENPVLVYLGKISYGLYMFHPIAIALAIGICKAANSFSDWLIYPLSFTFTFLMAWISFHYFESYFLAFKNKFSSNKNP